LKSIRRLKKKHLGHIQSLTTTELKALLVKVGFGIRRIRYSYHYLGQLYDVATVVALARFPGVAFQIGSLRDVSFQMSQASVFSKLLRNCAAAANRLGNVISFYESKILARWSWAISAHITCEKMTL
jgi:hypothetical protein